MSYHRWEEGIRFVAERYFGDRLSRRHQEPRALDLEDGTRRLHFSERAVHISGVQIDAAAG